MKTADNSFQGFPGCWNMAALVFFAVQPAAVVILVAVAFLALAMFTPLKFIHPVRTERWRSLSLPVALVWTALAGWAAWTGFAQPLAVTYGLIAKQFVFDDSGNRAASGPEASERLAAWCSAQKPLPNLRDMLLGLSRLRHTPPRPYVSVKAKQER